MLKLTEAELAEMGFKPYLSNKHLMCNGSVMWLVNRNTCCIGDGYYGDIQEAYPQTKEDLLTLIRVFTPKESDKNAD